MVFTESWEMLYNFEKGHRYDIGAEELANVRLIDGNLISSDANVKIEIKVEIDESNDEFIHVSIIHEPNTGIKIDDIGKRMLGNTFVGLRIDDSFFINLWRPKGAGPAFTMGYGIRPGLLIANGYFNTVITGDAGGSVGFTFPGPFKEAGLDTEGYAGGLIEFIFPVFTIATGGGIAVGESMLFNNDSSYVFSSAVDENGEEAIPIYLEVDFLFRENGKNTIQYKPYSLGIMSRYYMNVGSTFGDKFAVGVKLVF